jgi:hypothetical protein
MILFLFWTAVQRSVNDNPDYNKIVTGNYTIHLTFFIDLQAAFVI